MTHLLLREFRNRANLTAFCAAIVRIFFRLFPHQFLAVVAVLCGALSAQSAFAYGAFASREERKETNGFVRLVEDNKHAGIATGTTQAEADSAALAACEATARTGFTETTACAIQSEKRFQNQCAVLVVGRTRGNLNSRNPFVTHYVFTYYLGTSLEGGTPAEAVAAGRVFCMGAGATTCGQVFGTAVCDSTCTEPMIPKTDGNAGCRARQPSDCTGGTPILDGGNCRARQASDCTGNTPVFENGNCRARQQSDCDGTATPILAGNICRARVDADCTGNTPILDSGDCRARQQSDCDGTATLILAGNICRARVDADCTGNTPILDSGDCRARQQSDCTGSTPILDGGNCRARQPGDCPEATPVLDSGSCRARQQSDCIGSTPIFEGGNCRVRQASDCTGNTPILDGGNCRARGLRDVAATNGYAADDCRNAGWTPMITSDRERCPIRHGEGAATSGGGESPAALAIPQNHGATTREA